MNQGLDWFREVCEVVFEDLCELGALAVPVWGLMAWNFFWTSGSSAFHVP